MSDASPTPATATTMPPAAPAWRRPLLITTAVTMALLGLFGARAVYRGSVVDDAPRDPASASDGLVRQLLLQDGRKVARSALVVDAPVDAVWGAITDYARYHEFIGNLAGPLTATPDGAGRTRVTGEAALGPLRWPFEAALIAEEAAGRRTLRWDQGGGEIAVNRGAWTLSAPTSGTTLVVYTLDLEVPRYPAWLVRYVTLNRSRPLLRAVAAEATRRAAAAR